MTCNDQVTVGASSQIADECGFDVNAFHDESNEPRSPLGLEQECRPVNLMCRRDSCQRTSMTCPWISTPTSSLQAFTRRPRTGPGHGRARPLICRTPARQYDVHVNSASSA